MTIKKPMKAPTAVKTVVSDVPEMPAAGGAPAAAGGATIADRFKLDTTDPSQKKGGPAGLGTKLAVVAAIIALGVAGFVTFLLFQHLEFLKGA